MLSNQHYQHRTNQKLRSWANAVFQNRGVCGQAFPSFPSPSPVIPFFGSRPNFLDKLARKRLLRRLAATQARISSAWWPMNLLPCSLHGSVLFYLRFFWASFSLTSLEDSSSWRTWVFPSSAFSLTSLEASSFCRSSVWLQKNKSVECKKLVLKYIACTTLTDYPPSGLERSEVRETDFLWWPMSLQPCSLYTFCLFL